MLRAASLGQVRHQQLGEALQLGAGHAVEDGVGVGQAGGGGGLGRVGEVLGSVERVVTGRGGGDDHREMRVLLENLARRELTEALALLRTGLARQRGVVRAADGVDHEAGLAEEVVGGFVVDVDGQSDGLVRVEPSGELVDEAGVLDAVLGDLWFGLRNDWMGEIFCLTFATAWNREKTRQRGAAANGLLSQRRFHIFHFRILQRAIAIRAAELTGLASLESVANRSCREALGESLGKCGISQCSCQGRDSSGKILTGGWRSWMALASACRSARANRAAQRRFSETAGEPVGEASPHWMAALEKTLLDSGSEQYFTCERRLAEWMSTMLTLAYDDNTDDLTTDPCLSMTPRIASSEVVNSLISILHGDICIWMALKPLMSMLLCAAAEIA